MRISRLFMMIFCGLFTVILVSAQDKECSTLIEDALQDTDEHCKSIGRNQVCYGNTQISATFVESTSNVPFEIPGDIVDVQFIESLQLSMLQEPNEWGIALMKIQANLPDTVPGQNVTMLLFGDVFIEDQASNMTDNEEFGAMQAFIFRSGVGELACQEAPPDGILVQTPSGVGTVLLNANNVSIELGSTTFLNSVPNDVMRIIMLEGQASVTAEGVTQTVTAGSQAVIPLDEDGLANGAPEISIYEVDDFVTLPLAILDEPFELPREEIAANDGSIVLSSNEFCFAGREEDLPCEDFLLVFELTPGEMVKNYAYDTGEEGNTWTYVSDNVYEFSYEVNSTDEEGNPNIWRSELTIVSSDLITVELFDHLGESFPKWYYTAVEDKISD